MRHTLWDSALTFKRGVGEKVAFVLLNQLDLMLTTFALSIGFFEMNPLMRSLVASPLHLLIAKLIIPITIAWFVPGKLLLPAIALLLFIVGWDMQELISALL